MLVGFGDSYQAIVNLYGKRPSNEVKDLVKGTVAFLNRTTLKPLIPVMDESMVDWYYQNSVIFTSNFNTCWTGGGTGNGTNGNGSNGEATSQQNQMVMMILANVQERNLVE